MQKSTVSLIVGNLVKDRWIVEGGIAHLPRGRKPRLLMLDIDRAGIIGVNVMPHSTTMVLADLNTSFHSQVSFPTPAKPEALVSALTDRMRKLMSAHSKKTFEAIGISLPGRVDRKTEALVFAPNLGWRNVDIKGPLEKAIRLPVSVENAANACALSETWAGPLAGIQDLVAVTVSEGIGTGIIANGHLVRGSNGAAGEFGHMCIDPRGPVCHCGSRGCWEVYASNAAALREYHAAPESKRRKVPRGKVQSGRSSAQFGELLLLADQGDAVAIKVLNRMAYFLGLGFSVLANGLSPAVITVVGEVTRAWNRIGPVIQSAFQEHNRALVPTRIIPSDESTQPRLRGTVALVLQKYFRPYMFS